MQPGTARTGRFQFSTATLCVAPMASQKAINPTAHALGLVKNVKVDSTPSKVDLTQGIFNDVVATVTNGMAVTASAEVYEFTAQNLAYGMGLDGSALQPKAAPVALTGAVASAATTAAIAGAGDFAVGGWGFLQEGRDDAVHLFRVSAAGANSISFDGYPVPSGVAFSPAGRAGSLNMLAADPSKADQTWAVRIIGIDLATKSPVIVHFPKCRITRGFSMAFQSDNFGNLPFEFTPMAPIPTDPGFDPLFKDKMSVFVP